MSIIIKGMEMPKRCYDCPMCYDMMSCTATGLRFYSDTVDLSIDPADGRMHNCPLIELPPHGDLVDRNQLSKSLNRLCDRVCEYSEAQRETMCSACPLYSGIIVVEDDVPTIIEAEENKSLKDRLAECDASDLFPELTEEEKAENKRLAKDFKGAEGSGTDG